MSLDLQQQLDHLQLSGSDASGGSLGGGLEVPQVRKQRSQRFTIPTSPPQHSKPRSPAPPIPSLPYQPPPPPVQSQSIGSEPYYSFNRNPPIERSASTEIPTPVSGPPYLAPGQAEEQYGSHLTAFNLPPNQQQQQHYQPYHPQPISQHSYAPQQQSPSSYGQNYVPAPSYGGGGGGGGGYQRGGGRQEQSNGGGGGGGARSGLPTEWMRPQQQGQAQQYEQPAPSYQTGYAALMGRPLPEDEVIPTAIVIKNIPFQVPKEHLLGVMEDLRLPPPFAFNYHFDNGQFRGLAFANFRAAGDAALTVSALNGFDLQGRKLRTEFKKVLKEGEKERIERDKAIKRMRSTRELSSLEPVGPPPGWNRREASAPGGYPMSHSSSAPVGGGGGGGGQADDEDYGRLVQGQFSTFGSASAGGGAGAVGSAKSFGAREYVPAPVQDVYAQGGNGYSASPPSEVGTSISARMANSASGSGSEASGSGKSDLDLNDPQSLTIYTSIAQFKSDPLRDEFAFSKSLSAALRRTVHQSAKMLELGHRSVGSEEERHVVVFRKGTTSAEPAQKPLRHSASTVGRSSSRDLLSSYLSPPDSYSSPSSNAGLRGKKSMPDIRYHSSSSPHSHSHSNGLSPSYASYPSHHHQPPPPPPHHAANQRRSNMNLREGYATVGTAARSRPSVQGIFQASNFFESSTSAAQQPPASATQYYSSDASSSPSRSLSLSGGAAAESSSTSEEGSLGAGAGGQTFAVRQPRGPSEEQQRGFVASGGAGSWRGGSPAEGR